MRILRLMSERAVVKRYRREKNERWTTRSSYKNFFNFLISCYIEQWTWSNETILERLRIWPHPLLFCRFHCLQFVLDCVKSFITFNFRLSCPASGLNWELHVKRLKRRWREVFKKFSLSTLGMLRTKALMGL